MSQKTWLNRLLCFLGTVSSILLGFYLTHEGLATWDSLDHLAQCDSLLRAIHLKGLGFSQFFTEGVKWYGPLWQWVLGLASVGPFYWLNDPLWVHHALTFSLFPVSLYLLVSSLKRSGYSELSAFLCICLLIGTIRLGGHALLNVKDFPLAVGILLYTVWTWEIVNSSKTVFVKTLLVSAMGAGVYLIRPPMVLPWAIGNILIVLRASKGARERLLIAGTSGLVFVLICYLFWPALWSEGPVGWFQEATLRFKNFPFPGYARFFGETYKSTELPAYYPLIWLPVMMDPVAFIGVLIGAISSVYRLAVILKEKRTFPPLGLQGWIFLNFLVLSLSLITLHPVLYDEERHVLFIYPLFIVSAGLGFEVLPRMVKIIAVPVILAASIASYSTWGKFSYVYKSPFVDRNADQWTGDYWGVCVPEAVRKLAQIAPAGSHILVPTASPAAWIQAERLGAGGPLTKIPGFKSYIIESKRNPSWNGPYYMIVSNRMDWNKSLEELISLKKAELIDRIEMPPGDSACITVLIGNSLSN